MSATRREPKVGEVWVGRPGPVTATAAIRVVEDGEVCYRKKTRENTSLQALRITEFLCYYNPPKEPWQEPHEAERWYGVNDDGSLSPGGWPAKPRSRTNHASNHGYFYPAIVKCKVIPMLDTLEEGP